MVSLTSNIWYERFLQATKPCGRDQPCICFISQPYIICNTEHIILLFTLLFYTVWWWLLYVAKTCSCYYSHYNTVAPWWVVFLSLCYDQHRIHFQHTLPITCFATWYSKSVQAVMGKNVMFVKPINMANMNFLDLLGQYPVWTSLALLTIFDKVWMISSNSPDELWEKTFTASPLMFNEYIL